MLGAAAITIAAAIAIAAAIDFVRTTADAIATLT